MFAFKKEFNEPKETVLQRELVLKLRFFAAYVVALRLAPSLLKAVGIIKTEPSTSS